MDNEGQGDSQQQDSHGTQDAPVNPPNSATEIPKLPPRDPQILEEGKKISDLHKRNE